MSDNNFFQTPREINAQCIENILQPWLDTIHCPILVYNESGIICFANAAAGALFCYPSPQLCGMHLSAIEQPDAHSTYLQDVASLGWGAGSATVCKTQQKLDVHVQRVDWYGETWFIYTAQSCTEKQFLLEKTNQYARDLSLFQLFLMGLLDTSNCNTYEFIAQNLKEFSGALFVSISEYNRESRHLVHRHIEIDSQIMGKLFQWLGTTLNNLQTPLSETDYEHVLRSGWTIEKSLYEISFHSIPQPITDAVQRSLKIDHFIGISFVYEGELLGTSLLGMQVGTLDPSIEMLQAFRYAISLFLHVRRIQQKMQQLSEVTAFSKAMENKRRIAHSMASHLQQLHKEIVQECANWDANTPLLQRFYRLSEEISALLHEFSDSDL